MKKTIALLSLLLVVAGCTHGSRDDLKSPCVGLEGSPCGPKRNVNDWWLS